MAHGSGLRVDLRLEQRGLAGRPEVFGRAEHLVRLSRLTRRRFRTQRTLRRLGEEQLDPEPLLRVPACVEG